MLTITYAGYNLIVPTREILAEVEAVLRREDLYDMAPAGDVGVNLLRLGLPKLPTPFCPRLGEWWYPTGASRCSIFRGLIDSATLAKMNVSSSFAGYPTAGTLAFHSDTGSWTDESMFMLPPRPLLGLSDSTGLYEIILVDERYFWRFQLSNFITCEGDYSSTSTWADMISVLSTDLGISISMGSISSNYGKPEPDSPLYSTNENAAVMLDMVLANVGMVLCRGLSASYTAQTWASAREASASSRLNYHTTEKTGGGFIYQPNPSTSDYTRAAVLPSSVTVTFPMWTVDVGYVEPTNYRQYHKFSYGEVYVATINLSSLGSGYSTLQSFGGTRVLHTTAKKFSDGSTDTSCTNLAAQLAQDYYDAELACLDEVYRGLQAWTPDGCCDILWSFREDRLSTRVSRRPLDFFPREFQHGFGPIGVSGAYLTIWDIDTAGDPGDSAELNTNVLFFYPANAWLANQDSSSSYLHNPSIVIKFAYGVQTDDGSPSSTHNPGILRDDGGSQIGGYQYFVDGIGGRTGGIVESSTFFGINFNNGFNYEEGITNAFSVFSLPGTFPYASTQATVGANTDVGTYLQIWGNTISKTFTLRGTDDWYIVNGNSGVLYMNWGSSGSGFSTTNAMYFSFPDPSALSYFGINVPNQTGSGPGYWYFNFGADGSFNCTGYIATSSYVSAAGFQLSGIPGVSGSFTSADGHTISVSGGIIIAIS